MQCHTEPCHPGCAFGEDKDKISCYVMKGDHCCICNCHWSKHSNLPYIQERYKEIETETSDMLLKKYNIAVEGKNKAKQLKEKIEEDLIELANDVFFMIIQVQNSLTRLDEIALKPNPLTSEEYLSLLINEEKNNKRDGWKERIGYYEEAKKQAKLLFGVKKNSQELKVVKKNIQEVKTGKKPKSDLGVDFTKWIKKIKAW
jgi:hypothetical protein